MSFPDQENLPSHGNPFTNNVQRHGWWLIAAFVLAMPLGKGFELPLALMAISGIVIFIKEGRSVLHNPSLRWLLLLFACIWLPIFFALPDAVKFDRAASTALTFLRFPMAGIFAIYALQNDTKRQRLFLAICAILSFWVADGVLQAVTGHDIFGFPFIGDRLSGVFYPKLTMGLMLAPLAPIYFEAIRRLSLRWGRGVWLTFVPYTAVVLLTGSRSAWVMYAAGMVGFAIYLYFITPQRRVGRAILIVLLFTIPMAALLTQYVPFQNKLRATAGLFSGNYEKIDQATSLRLPIWQTALKISGDHWLNGIGPRGFRYIYPRYAEPGDPFMAIDPTSGPTHPHQTTLEILVETGSIGVIGFGIFLTLMLRRVWLATRAGNTYAVPLGLSVLVVTMPINSGLAFYGSVLSALTWWLIALYCATLQMDHG